MELWDEQINKRMLVLPWSCAVHPSSDLPPLLLKFGFQTDPFRLTLLATNLEEAFIETLNQRQLTRRVQDALSESKDTQTQSQSFTGVGEEGEQVMKQVVEEMMDAVVAGTAKVTMETAAYSNDILISVSSFTFRFLCNSLGSQSASCLQTQLIVPLLGCASSLLSLIPNSAVADGSLATALDASAKGESLQEGRVAKAFFGAGSSVFGRWTQKYTGVKEKNLQPVTLEAPRRRGITTPPSPTKPSTKPAPSSSSKPPPTTLAPPTPSFNILRSSGKGEKVNWEDSQHTQATSSSKGKGVAVDEPMGTGSDEEEEEKELTPPPAAQLPSSPSKSNAKRKHQETPPLPLPEMSPSDDEIQNVEDAEPPTDDEAVEDPIATASGSLPPEPTPSASAPLKSPSPTQEEKTEKSNKKKEAAAKEAQEAKEFRKAQIAKAKKAEEAKAKAGGAGAAAKKKVRKL